MRVVPLLPFLLLACCATLPRVDDQTDPKRAFETFRGAVARKEYRREWACLSDRIKPRLGLESRADWADARTIVLTQGHRLIRGLLRAKIEGEPQRGADGRVMLKLDFPFGYEGRVWLLPVPVLRIWTEGEETPFYEHLYDLEVVVGPDAAGVRGVPPEVASDLREDLAGKRVTAFVARVEWFIDDFAAGGDTPQTIRQDMEQVE